MSEFILQIALHHHHSYDSRHIRQVADKLRKCGHSQALLERIEADWMKILTDNGWTPFEAAEFMGEVHRHINGRRRGK